MAVKANAVMVSVQRRKAALSVHKIAMHVLTSIPITSAKKMTTVRSWLTQVKETLTETV